MTNPTYAEIKAKVEADLDLQEETFISDTEMLGYCNEAIREAVAEIHGIYEDYFLTKAFMPLSVGVADYPVKDFAPNLYAHKIRSLVYADGTKIYDIQRIRSHKKFSERAVIDLYGTADYYRYIPRNDDSVNGLVLELCPPSKEASTTHVTIWYLREVAQVVNDTDPVDIPEFKNFIMAYMKYKCWSKEMAGNAPELIVKELEHERALMIDTLTNMVADDESEVEKDLSIYEDMV